MLANFHKYHGTGNDFIIIDNRKLLLSDLSEEMISRLCHRRFGIGADGLILIQDKHDYDFDMIYYNSDGRLSSMCGNGGRCIVHLASKLGIINETTRFHAIDGMHTAIISGQQVELKMNDVGEIKEKGQDLILDTGSPHYVVFGSDVASYNIDEKAKKIRYSADYIEKGINVNFVEVNEEGKENIFVRTYERGVESETYSCGTGVVASSIATAYRIKGNGKHAYNILTPGGLLNTTFLLEGNTAKNVKLKGPAVHIYKGEIEI